MNYTKFYQGVDWVRSGRRTTDTVLVEIDMRELAWALARKADGNKSGQSQALNGAVRVTLQKPERKEMK